MKIIQTITRASIGALAFATTGMLACIFFIGMFGNPQDLDIVVVRLFVAFATLFGVAGVSIIVVNLFDPIYRD